MTASQLIHHMRPFLRHQAPQVLASALTLLVALALGSARDWSVDRGRDSAIRVTRGAQRLDMADTASHACEDPEIVVAPVSDIVSESRIGVDGPGTPCIPAAPPPVGRDVGVALACAVTDSGTLARSGTAPCGRAPPSV